MNKMKVAVIGKGYWGTILKPYIAEYFDIVSVTGRNDTNIEELSKKVDAFFIITNIKSHFNLAEKCLLQKKHVFIEKPITISYKEAIKLKKIAKKNKVILYTDYTEMVAPSRLYIKKMVKYIGKIKEINAVTTKHGNFKENSVFWSLGSHQVSVLSLFLNLKKIKFQKKIYNIDKKIILSGVIFSNKKIKIFLYSNIAKSKRKKTFEIHGEKGSIQFDAYDKKTIKLEYLDKNKYLCLNFNYDEKNNLKYSVEKFKNIIEKKDKNNLKTSILITKIIEKLEEK